MPRIPFVERRAMVARIGISGVLFPLFFIGAWGLLLHPLLRPHTLAAESQKPAAQEGNRSDTGRFNLRGLDSQHSPRLTRLAHDLEAGNREALGAFWKGTAGKAPLVETDTGNKRQRLVTFLWRGDDRTRRVTILGGLPGANLATPLTRLGDTDLWYLTESHATERGSPTSFRLTGQRHCRWNGAPS